MIIKSRRHIVNDTVSNLSVIVMSDYKPDIHKELFDVSEAGDCSRVRELLEAGADPHKYKDVLVELLCTEPL